MTHELDPDRAQQVIQNLQDSTRRRGVSLDEASSGLIGLGVEASLVEAAVSQIREEGRRNQMLKVPGGMEGLEYKRMTKELQHRRWYLGPRDGDLIWPAYLESLVARGLDDRAIRSIDQASTKVVSYLGDPGVHGLQTKGLVIGHVQSGKTSNYMAVIAKAADAGYRLVIVLSGMYNALRQQTQRRLNAQVVDPTSDDVWQPLTYEDADFGQVLKGGAMLAQPELRVLVVTKKNVHRLRRLCLWLKSVHGDTRHRCPALIIDDEADQATPNTGQEDDKSTINSLVFELFKLLPTSSYIGYTATPFANVFIDPSAKDLYPSNFIISLPRPRGYFGAESIFGRSPLDDGDDPDDGYDMVRKVTTSEAAALRPPRNRDEREGFRPAVQPSLDEAVRYFLLATAARRARGHNDEHSSMLVHTTQYSAVHLRQRAELRSLVDSFRRKMANRDGGFIGDLRRQWDEEKSRVDPRDFGHQPSSFEDLVDHLPDVLLDTKVIADNYISEDRLDYSETTIGPDGRTTPIPQTVIAVGGNTLSRGLTLEGLVVSYFIRSGRAYDTLLQMGRWFGFRPGYEDLPRVWMTTELKRQFRFLATVEEEIRRDVERYEREGMTPQQYGVRVRCHPDLMITAGSKMQATEKVSLSYSGDRLQTFLFQHRDRDWLEQNQSAARDLVTSALRSGSESDGEAPDKVILRQVHYERIVEFLRNYQFHEDYSRLRSDLLIGYIQNRLDHAAELEWWNVAVMSGPKQHRVGGSRIDLGAIDLGLGSLIPCINRAPMADSLPDRADIKALMSKPDRVVDIRDVDSAEARNMSETELVRIRSPDIGLLLLYPISKNSIPMGASIRADSRKDLKAVADIIGVGIVFPESRKALEENPTYEYDYVAVRIPDEDPLLEETDDVDPEKLDTERDARVEPVLPETD